MLCNSCRFLFLSIHHVKCSTSGPSVAAFPTLRNATQVHRRTGARLLTTSHKRCDNGQLSSGIDAIAKETIQLDRGGGNIQAKEEVQSATKGRKRKQKSTRQREAALRNTKSSEGDDELDAEPLIARDSSAPGAGDGRRASHSLKRAKERDTGDSSSPENPTAKVAKSAEAAAKKQRKPEAWQTQKAALEVKFKEGYEPRKRLSPDALPGIRMLHASDPQTFSTPVLAMHFKVSPEAIRRILKSKWRPSEDEEEDRRLRWDRRGERIWTQLAELGTRPPKKWRSMGVGRVDRKVGELPAWRKKKKKKREQDGHVPFVEEDVVDDVVLSKPRFADRIL